MKYKKIKTEQGNNFIGSNHKLKYSFSGKLWKFQTKGSWFFVSLPKTLSKKIRDLHYVSEEGWGRLKTSARIKNTEWSTSIWYDTKIGTYIIPVKAAVRKSESLSEDKLVKIYLTFHHNTYRKDLK